MFYPSVHFLFCFFSHFPFHLWTLDPIWTMISTLTSLWPLRWPTFISGKISGNCVPSASATHRLASAFIHDSEASTQIGGTFDIQEFATQHGFAPLFWGANRRIPQTRLSRSTSGAWLNRLGPGSRKGPPLLVLFLLSAPHPSGHILQSVNLE